MNEIAADSETFRIWARLMHGRQSQLWDDAVIAATAIQMNATVVTHNVRDFRLFDVAIVDPFA
jgi:toxin FitB